MANPLGISGWDRTKEGVPHRDAKHRDRQSGDNNRQQGRRHLRPALSATRISDEAREVRILVLALALGAAIGGCRRPSPFPTGDPCDVRRPGAKRHPG